VDFITNTSGERREPTGWISRRHSLDHLILFGERRLVHVLKEFVVHYHEERNHQGLDNALIAPA
jgi:hypothetical protein